MKGFLKLLAWLAAVAILLLVLLRLVLMPLLVDRWHLPEANLSALPAKSSPANQHDTVPLSQISKWMQLAILATEDHRFYQHHGIDSLGLIRAGIDNLLAGHMVEGASTISQQLAKIAFLNQEERTARRKFSQIILAVELEDKYTKEQILEAYLNRVYFGRGAYGIESAARTYFGIPASKLSIAQAAFLAGIVRAPSVLGDKHHLDDALLRQRQVIQSMHQYGYITDAQFNSLINQKFGRERT